MNIGLALSGGGTRAAVFHLGLLLRLARENLLEHVVRLSTVSGGSLVMALLFCHNNMRWPTSQEFIESVYPRLRTLLTSTDLASFSALLKTPAEWHRLPFNRAESLSNLLKRRWGIRGSLQDLPETPGWLINTTCVETGKNWRFSKFHMGDWIFGHHYAPPVSIAHAVAASAAIPYVIGALHISLPEEGWYEIDPATDTPLKRKQPPLPAVRLWDGGAYENLGIEPLYKPDRKLIKCDTIIVSDASGYTPTLENRAGIVSTIANGNLATPRLFAIASEQIRALRSRMLVDAILSGKASGALVRIGNSVRDIDIQTKRIRSDSEYKNCQLDSETALAWKHPTNLASVSTEGFERIARHAYECTDATLTAYKPDILPTSKGW